jgi:hypothetical protein
MDRMWGHDTREEQNANLVKNSKLNHTKMVHHYWAHFRFLSVNKKKRR